MYSEAIWTCSALIPGSEATFLPSSSNIGARYDGSIDLFESLILGYRPRGTCCEDLQRSFGRI